MSGTHVVALISNVDMCKSPAVIRVKLSTSLNPSEPCRLRPDKQLLTDSTFMVLSNISQENPQEMRIQECNVMYIVWSVYLLRLIHRQPLNRNQHITWRTLDQSWSRNSGRDIRIYRVAQLKWGQLTFLMVTFECIVKSQWFLAHVNYIQQEVV